MFESEFHFGRPIFYHAFGPQATKVVVRFYRNFTFDSHFLCLKPNRNGKYVLNINMYKAFLEEDH